MLDTLGAANHDGIARSSHSSLESCGTPPAAERSGKRDDAQGQRSTGGRAGVEDSVVSSYMSGVNNLLGFPQ